LGKAKAVAAGDGAIQLMMAALESNQLKPFRGRGVPVRVFEVGDLQVTVHLVPTSGLIDLNGASKELLNKLFASAEDGAGTDTQLLADNVIKWRSQLRRGSRQRAQFQSIEDLLKVEGVDRALLSRVRDSMVAGKTKRSGVDWMSAPRSVMAVLAGNNAAVVSAVVEGRENGYSPGQTIPRGMNPRFQSVGAGNDYRVDAVVSIGDKQWLRRRWVDASTPGDGLLPWRYTATEAARALPQSTGSTSADTRGRIN
jgi:general secretion pathway protein K